MTVNVQDDTGDVANANAYVSVADFKSYHDDRGNTYVNDDTKIGQAIIRATMYLDARFRFFGVKLTSTQTTEWPRRAGNSWDCCGADLSEVRYFCDADGYQVIGIHTAVKNATLEYALRAMTIPLFQDAPAPQGGLVITEHNVQVDVIQEQIKFANMQGINGSFQMPAFPQADLMLTRAGLIATGRLLYR